MFSNCERCGRELKDPWSAREGIGPVCKRKLEAAMRSKVMLRANYEIVEHDDSRILIKDIGPWDKYATITNAAEWVVEQLAPQLNGRELHYVDSEGNIDKLLVVNGKFAGFAAIDSYKPDLDRAPQEDDEGLDEDEVEDILDEMNRDYNRSIANSLKARE